MEPLPLLVLHVSKQVLLFCTSAEQAHKNATVKHLWASFADDVQFSPSLDDFAGVTQFLDGRAHTHRAVGEISRAPAYLRQSATQRRCQRTKLS